MNKLRSLLIVTVLSISSSLSGCFAVDLLPWNRRLEAGMTLTVPARIPTESVLLVAALCSGA